MKGRRTWDRYHDNWEDSCSREGSKGAPRITAEVAWSHQEKATILKLHSCRPQRGSEGSSRTSKRPPKEKYVREKSSSRKEEMMRTRPAGGQPAGTGPEEDNIREGTSNEDLLKKKDKEKHSRPPEDPPAGGEKAGTEQEPSEMGARDLEDLWGRWRKRRGDRGLSAFFKQRRKRPFTATRTKERRRPRGKRRDWKESKEEERVGENKQVSAAIMRRSRHRK